LRPPPDQQRHFARPTVLPEWTRQHLVAHVAATADALGNLVRWAATDQRMPMYATPEERAALAEHQAQEREERIAQEARAQRDRMLIATYTSAGGISGPPGPPRGGGAGALMR
jgi:maleylpyruvate isomerase